MPKANKSSASSGTRKKHAKKSGKEDDADVPTAQPAQRGQKKLTKAQKKLPKVKQYIPPPKPPAPLIPDPLDGQGLARTLPAELVVVLRRLGKKDEVTRRKGLEELREWIASTRSGDEVEMELNETALLSAIPVWLHNLASLLQSPFHRTLALQLQSELLNLPSTRTAIIDSLALSLLPGTQNRDVLGSWFVAALEDGRRSGVTKGWEDSTCWDGTEGRVNLSEHFSSLVEYLSLAILDPTSLHDDIHPSPVSTAPVKKAAKPKFVMPTDTPEEEDPADNERLSRYRVGGIIGLGRLVQLNPAEPSSELLVLLRHPILWSALSSEDSNVGSEQPAIRKAAYALLDVLVDTYPDVVRETGTLTLLSCAVLGSCWEEKDASVWQQAGQAIVKFLSKYKECWTIACRESEHDEEIVSANKDESSDEEDEDKDDEEPPSVSQPKPLADFLGWVSTICPLIPHLTYPLLLVIVSTLPDDLLPLAGGPSDALQSFFTHLWSPIDARLLSTHSMPTQQSAFQAFFQDAVDCTVFLIGKAMRRDDGRSTAEWLVREQLAGRAWVEGVLEMGAKAGKRRGQESTEFEADVFGKALGRVAATDSTLVDLALPILSGSLADRCFQTEEEHLTKSASVLLQRSLGILSAVQGDGAVSLGKVITNIVRRTADNFSSEKDPSIYAEVLLAAMQGENVDEEIRQTLSRALQTNLPAYISTLSPQTIINLFEAISIDDKALSISLWSAINSPNTPREARYALSGILAASNSPLAKEEDLDQITLEATQTALEVGTPSAIAVARSAVARPSGLSSETLHTVLALVCTSIHDQVDDIITGSEEARIPLAALEIFAPYAELSSEELAQSDVLLQALVAIHHLVSLLPRNSLETFTPPATATAIWKVVANISSDGQEVVAYKLAAALKEMLGQVSCLVEPAVLVDVALSSQIGSQISDVQDLLPSEVLTMVSKHAEYSAPSTLPIIESLASITEQEIGTTSFDAQGRSQAARYAEAALSILRSNRQLAQADNSLLFIVLCAATFAKDTLDIPTGGRGFYSPTTDRTLLLDFIREVEGTLSFALATIDDGSSWHKSAVAALAFKNPSDPADFLQRLLVSVKNEVLRASSDIAARVFRDLLERHLRQSGAAEEDLGIWLAFTMPWTEKSTPLFIALMLAIKPSLLDSERYQREQNRLASYLTTIKPTQAGKEGMPAVRRLLASAPPADAPSVFLPQQRAIFVLRHVASWLTSDAADDFDDSMEVYVTQLYTALAPVVQDVSGSHWDAIFDMIENGLEGASMEDESTHCLLYNCLILLQQVRDLSASNKSLRAVWTGKDQQLGLVLKLFLQCREAISTPTKLIHAAILDLLRDVPDKAIEAGDINELCDILRLSTSTTIQCTAYGILSRVIKTRTVGLVLEAESAPEDQPLHIALPARLTGIFSQLDWLSELELSTALSQLLAWMAVLDHFEDASRTLRWAYLDEITSSKLLEEKLVPMLFAILGITEVGAWNFPSSQFGIDEFYADLLEPEELADLAPLASHLFYRALITLPSAMRTYYESLKDRQLSMSMLNFTARHYSPVIIKQEFSALRQPAAMALLTEEGLSVRIAQGGGATVAAGTGSAEAVASYVVDEQPMEIGIRLPAEFPLRGVEIRDLKRVGVPENKWRGWLMSVQQTITSRNGLILEALTVFKKNVSLHFEGVVECAICYSIISLTDRTLPTKPCRTCKNRFHASCLFKWFNSSHSSSCPMCRALF